MAISEKARHELCEWFRENAGEDRAETMMDLLPPTGWGDVATRRDLEVFRAEFRAELAELRTQMAEMNADIAERMRVQMLTMISVFVGVTGLFFTLGQILG